MPVVLVFPCSPFDPVTRAYFLFETYKVCKINITFYKLALAIPKDTHPAPRGGASCSRTYKNPDGLRFCLETQKIPPILLVGARGLPLLETTLTIKTWFSEVMRAYTRLIPNQCSNGLPGYARAVPRLTALP